MKKEDEDEIELSYDEFEVECIDEDVQCFWETVSFAKWVRSKPELQRRAKDLISAMIRYYEWFEDNEAYEFLDRYDNGYLGEDLRAEEGDDIE